MLRALQMIRQRNGGRDVPTYMHPGMYRCATRPPTAMFRLFEDVPSAHQLAQHGAGRPCDAGSRY
jgi:7,8-dihydropterin-6-yl-methyl-4-(beta-D-ribofuranosyl)aminobenzene 5'-phosphate synthase